MATFVLNHGAWGGGWEWKGVGDRLTSQGHTVYRNSFTGLGERIHLASPEVGLDTHVHDIVSLFESERLEDVILCGHSYSGTVITGAAPHIESRLRHIVFIDAFLPNVGDTQFDLTPEPMVEGMRAAIDSEGEGWKIPLPFPIPGPGEAPPEVIDYITRASTPMPIRCFDMPSKHSAAEISVPVTFVKCTQIEEMDFLAAAEEKARSLGWPVIPIDAPHDVQFFAPDALADILHGVTEDSGG